MQIAIQETKSLVIASDSIRWTTKGHLFQLSEHTDVTLSE